MRKEKGSRSSEMIGLAVRVRLFLPRPVRGLSRPPVVRLVSALTPACIWRGTVLQTFLKLAASRASVHSPECSAGRWPPALSGSRDVTCRSDRVAAEFVGQDGGDRAATSPRGWLGFHREALREALGWGLGKRVSGSPPSSAALTCLQCPLPGGRHFRPRSPANGLPLLGHFGLPSWRLCLAQPVL